MQLEILFTLMVPLTLTDAMLSPLEEAPPAPEGSDTLVHLAAFTVLALPLARTGRFGLLPVFIGAGTFGGPIERIQPSFNRSDNAIDWVADIFSAAMGTGCSFVTGASADAKFISPWVVI